MPRPGINRAVRSPSGYELRPLPHMTAAQTVSGTVRAAPISDEGYDMPDVGTTDPAAGSVVVPTPTGYDAVSSDQIASAELAVAAKGAAAAVTTPSGYDAVSAGQIARAEAAQETVSGLVVCGRGILCLVSAGTGLS